MHDPAAGSPLIRLLAGARWRIGAARPRRARDARRLVAARHDWQQKAVSDEVRRGLRDSVAVDDGASIVDALDFVATAPA